MRGKIYVAALVAACVLFGPWAQSAMAESPMAAFTGAWRGKGQVRLSGGQTEPIECRAYYTQKEGGATVNLALTCASTSHKIQMRASLAVSGNTIVGDWEERTFNATGTVAGTATAGRLNVAITGGGLTGNMSITTLGGDQSIRISTEGTGFQGLTMRLKKG